MTRILDVSQSDMDCRVEAGVTRDQLNAKVTAQSVEVKRILALQKNTQGALDENRQALAFQSVALLTTNYELAKLNRERASLDTLIKTSDENYKYLNKVKNEALLKNLSLSSDNLALEKEVIDRQEKVADLEKKQSEILLQKTVDSHELKLRRGREQTQGSNLQSRSCKPLLRSVAWT